MGITGSCKKTADICVESHKQGVAVSVLHDITECRSGCLGLAVLQDSETMVQEMIGKTARARVTVVTRLEVLDTGSQGLDGFGAAHRRWSRGGQPCTHKQCQASLRKEGYGYCT
jgi:hypothetical protein